MKKKDLISGNVRIITMTDYSVFQAVFQKFQIIFPNNLAIFYNFHFVKLIHNLFSSYLAIQLHFLVLLQQFSFLFALSWEDRSRRTFFRITSLFSDFPFIFQALCSIILSLTSPNYEEVLGLKPSEFLQGPETDPEMICSMSDELKAGRGFTT